jgi:threonine/homoserine/homoserine lactone efflux protein
LDLSILFGFLVGVVLALPPGPVGVTAIEIGLSQNKRAGFHLAIGNALMDFIYCLGVIFATSAVISTLSEFSHKFPFAYLVFQIGVISALFAIGFLNLRAKKKRVGEGEAVTRGFTEKLGTKGPMFLGVAIALTNLANPTFLPSLAAVTIWVHEMGMTTGSPFSNMMFAIGFGLGNLFWINFLSSMTNKYKHKFSPNTVLRIKQAAGVTFIGFGTFLGFRLLLVSKWPDILRFVLAF